MRLIARPLAFEARSHLNLSFRFAAGGSGGRTWVKLSIRAPKSSLLPPNKSVPFPPSIQCEGFAPHPQERCCQEANARACAKFRPQNFCGANCLLEYRPLWAECAREGRKRRFVEFNKKIRPQKRPDQSYKFSARESKSRFGIFCCRRESRPASPRGITGASRMRPCGKFPFRLRRRRRHS